MNLSVRNAIPADLQSILRIYNQGIQDRIATLETDEKDSSYMEEWFNNHAGRYTVLVAEQEGHVVGWASLNRYSQRCAYDGVADLSIYIDREYRGQGIGRLLLQELEQAAKKNGFYKIVLFTFPFNGMGQGLYRRCGYREVGIFENQGILDGKFVDVMAMEKVFNREEDSK